MQRVAARFIKHYNTERLFNAIGSVTPVDKLTGSANRIPFNKWDSKDAGID